MTTTFLKESNLPLIPDGYKEFLEEIKKKIQEAQFRASLSVDTELVKLYSNQMKNWEFDKEISQFFSLRGLDFTPRLFSSCFGINPDCL